LSFFVALGVLIIVHELGHYAVARWCGVKVTRFSVGFGKPLWSRRFGRDQTEWALAAIPLGGYVKMADEREGEVAAEDLPRAFNRQSVWKRFAIVLAGPTANFLLAIVLYWGLFMHGVQDLKSITAAPDSGTPAAQAGVALGDQVLSVNQQPVQSWQGLRWQVLHAVLNHQSIALEVLDAGNMRQWRVLPPVEVEQFEGDVVGKLGLLPYTDLPAIVGQIEPDSPAAHAGLQPGDRIVAIDDYGVDQWDELVRRVRAAPGRPVELRIERGNQQLNIQLTPERVGSGEAVHGRIGAGVDVTQLHQYQIEVDYAIGPAFMQAVDKTWDMSALSLRMMGKMLTGEVSWHNISGPVTIADYAGQSAQLGWASYIAFLAVVSISLGVLNLLPIPLLDGGHLMYYIVEIFKGTPVSERVMEMGQRAGLFLLLTLMVFAFYNDINRLLGNL
jgi:regulator of sigma E protease